MNIYFCGMIGTGKTTIGRRLAMELGLDFFDLDCEMDKRLGYSFHRLVAKEGWLAFRELEYAICRDFSRKQNAIVCLGGGTVRYDWNVDVLRPTGKTILLEAPLEELVRRVSKADRPRVNDGVSLEEDLRIMVEESHDKYLAAADYIYQADKETIEEEVKDIKAIIFSAPDLSELKAYCEALNQKE